MKTKLIFLFATLLFAGSMMAQETMTPTNCAEAAEAALSVSANNELYNNGAVYTINGYVTSIQTAYRSQYNNVSFWMADAADGGNVLEAYRAACAAEADAPAVGDKVAVTGSLTKYNTTPEFAAGCTFTIVERASTEEPVEEEIVIADTLTVAEAIELGMALDSMGVSEAVYAIEGYVINPGAFSLLYKNQRWYMADDAAAAASDFEAYNCFPIHGNDTLVVQAGDKVQLVGKLKKYYNKNAAKYIIEVEKGNAYFLIPFLTLTVTPESFGDINVASIDDYIQTITATPNYGYHFVQWNDGVTDNPRTVNLTQDTTFTAEFAVDRTGRCGDSLALTWTYEPETKTLTISGEGGFENNMQYGVEAHDQMEKLIIENGVTSIGSYAFPGCYSLSSVTIPNSVTSIGTRAFNRCTGLTSVTIPTGVTSIREYAFSGCSSLTSVTLNSNAIVAKTYSSDSNIRTIFGSQVSEYIIGDSVTDIGEYAFYNCTSLSSVMISNSVMNIGVGAFSNCIGLNSIEFPNSVTSIGSSAFYGCTGLNSIEFPNSVTSIGSSAFYGCIGLVSVEIPSNVTSIRSSAFNGCSSLTSVTLNSNAIVSKTSSDNNIYTIFGSQVSEYIIGDSVTSIGSFAFYRCTGLASITIPNSVINIGNHAFDDCNGLTSVTIPDSVTSIGNYAFWRTSLISVDIPNNVTYIGNFAFNECNKLTSVTIGNNVTYIGEVAFRGCKSLTNIYIMAETPPTLFTVAVFQTNVPIYVPCGTLDAYQSANNWSSYASVIQYPSSDYKISVVPSEHGNVIVPNNVCDSIIIAMPNYGYHFVQWHDGVTDNPRSVILTQDTTFEAEFAPDKSGVCGKDSALTWFFDDQTMTLTITGDGALTENYTYGVEAPSQMNTLIIDDGVTAIGDSAFYGKTTLQKVVIGSNVTSIGNYAFADINNRQLTSLVMPAELLYIGDYAFSGNTYIESIDFNAKLQTIGAYAFNDCYRVSEMTCLATTTPDLSTNALKSISSYASLCVPAECLSKYRVDPNWGRFNLCSLGSSATTTDTNSVTVDPSDNTALFTWPIDDNAASYSLQITKDGEVFCTLIFNSNGQLTGIAFAPSRNGAAHAQSATMSVSAMSFTVTGLNSASKYAYRLSVTDESQNEIQAYSGEFATIGYEGEVNPGGEPEINTEGFEDVLSNQKATKILRDGQILILRGNRTYTLTGQEVR